MHRDTSALTGGIKPGEGRVIAVNDHFTIFICWDASHRVMRRRLGGHHLGNGINAQIHTAKIHNVWNLCQDRFPGDFIRRTIWVGTPVLRGELVHRLRSNIKINIVLAVDAASLTDLRVNRARDHIPRSQIFDRWRVLWHESFTVTIDQNRSLTARAFRDENAEFVNARRMELEKFHIFKRQAMSQKDRGGISGIGIRIGCHFKDTSMPTRSDNYRFRMKCMQFACGKLHCDDPRCPAVNHDEIQHLKFIEERDFVLDALLI